MQDAALEVESNIVASQKLKGKVDRKKQSVDAPSSSDTKMEKMAKMLDSLTSEMSKLRVQGNQPMKGKEPNNFNKQVHILQRDRDAAEDQRIRAPFQNAVLHEEQDLSQGEGEEYDDINCVEDQVDSSFLTQCDYEEALMSEQINQASFEESLYQADDQGGYNLRSKPTAAKSAIAAPAKKSAAPAKQIAAPAKKSAAPAKQIAAPAKQQQKKLSLKLLIKSYSKLHWMR